jgi:hypothetical protein
MILIKDKSDPAKRAVRVAVRLPARRAGCRRPTLRSALPSAFPTFLTHPDASLKGFAGFAMRCGSTKS